MTPLIYLCFFISGLAGLVNEIVWSRLFGYTLGSSHISIAVVVSLFMGGLALGSAIGGPFADRSASPLRLYGWLALLTGILSGAVAPLLALGEPLVRAAYRLHDGQPNHPVYTAAKVALCAATILVPTTLMGATLPALTRHLARGAGEVGRRLGALYAINTLGAVAGAAAAGFVLIGTVGLGWTAAIGASLDVVVGLAVLLVIAPRTALAEKKDASPAGPRKGPTKGDRAPVPAVIPDTSAVAHPALLGSHRISWEGRAAVIAFGISGFVNMCLQIGWTRAITLSIGNSTYAFSLIVAIFILGLAVGGWIAGLIADRISNPLAGLGWVITAGAIASGLTIPWLGHSPAWFAWKMGRLQGTNDLDYIRFLASGSWSVAIVMFPATVLMGMTLPLVGRLRAAAVPGVGRAVGAAYAANTVGAILGTALSGFVLIPLLGRIWALLYLAVALGLGAGILVLLSDRKGARARQLACLAMTVVLFLSFAFVTRPAGFLEKDTAEPSTVLRSLWHPSVLAFGSFQNLTEAAAEPSPFDYVLTQVRTFEPLYYRDGELASVAVLRHRPSGNISMMISGKPEASSSEFSVDIQTQLLLGHLPVMLHPAPSRVLNLGLGGGMSLGALAAHPELEAIDLLEICPEVEESARLHFAEANNRALTDPRVRTIIGDGRNHLAHTSATYDVITSEPSNFWIAGLGNLFTEEFYRIALRRLNPQGLLCQWIYGYKLRVEDYKTALRTFLQVVPHVTVWSNDGGDTILIGSMEAPVFDRQRMASCMTEPAVRASLSRLGIASPEDAFRHFRCDGNALEGWIGDGPTNGDFHPVLEFKSPLGFFDLEARISLALAEASSAAPFPVALFRGFTPEALALAESRSVGGRSVARFFFAFSDNDTARGAEAYGELAKGTDSWALESITRLIADLPRSARRGRRDLIATMRSIRDTPELCIADGLRIGSRTDRRALLDTLRRRLAERPESPWQTYFLLARLEVTENRPDDARRSIEKARERGAPVYRIAQAEGILLGMGGNLSKAEEVLRRAFEETPPEEEKGEAAFNLGFCQEQLGKMEEAAGSYEAALRLDHEPLRSRISLARCLRLQGDLEGAARRANEAIATARAMGGESADALAEAGRAVLAGGNLEEAIRFLESAAKLAPAAYEGEYRELLRRAGR